jgi:hypothetical protein
MNMIVKCFFNISLRNPESQNSESRQKIGGAAVFVALLLVCVCGDFSTATLRLKKASEPF